MKRRGSSECGKEALLSQVAAAHQGAPAAAAAAAGASLLPVKSPRGQGGQEGGGAAHSGGFLSWSEAGGVEEERCKELLPAAGWVSEVSDSGDSERGWRARGVAGGWKDLPPCPQPPPQRSLGHLGHSLPRATESPAQMLNKGQPTYPSIQLTRVTSAGPVDLPWGPKALSAQGPPSAGHSTAAALPGQGQLRAHPCPAAPLCKARGRGAGLRTALPGTRGWAFPQGPSAAAAWHDELVLTWSLWERAP